MAGKKETSKKTTPAAKKPKNQESEVVSDEEMNDAVVSDSEESESYEANQSIIRSKKGVKFDKPNNKMKEIDTKIVSESESDGEEVEEEGEEEVEESEAEEVENSEGEEEEEEEESGGEEIEQSAGEEVEESEGEKEEIVKKIKKIEKTNGGEKLKGKENGKMSVTKPKSKGKGKGKGKELDKNECESESGSGMYKLPMRRISRIIKDETPDMRITHEATFLINKATEKFLELLARESYVCAFLDRKNQVAYNHLASAITKRSRFDFLSDFVPEKVKAEVALATLSMNEK